MRKTRKTLFFLTALFLLPSILAQGAVINYIEPDVGSFSVNGAVYTDNQAPAGWGTTADTLAGSNFGGAGNPISYYTGVADKEADDVSLGLISNQTSSNSMLFYKRDDASISMTEKFYIVEANILAKDKNLSKNITVKINNTERFTGAASIYPPTVQFNTDGYFYIASPGAANGLETIRTDFQYNTDEWYHVAVVYQKDLRTVDICVNGSKLISNHTMLGSNCTRVGGVKFQTMQNTGLYGEMLIDDFRTYQSSVDPFDPAPPEAKDVSMVCGDPVRVGDLITGSYTFYDVNYFDKEGNSVYTWYRSDANDFSGALTVGNSMEYSVSEADLGKYLWFSVKPVSLNTPYEGIEAVSDAAGPVRAEDVGPLAPVAENISVTGIGIPNQVLTGTYKYYDANGDPQDMDRSEALWKISDSVNGTWLKVGEGLTYTVSESDVNKYIRFEVTPYSVEQTEEPVTSYYDFGIIRQNPAVLDVELINLGVSNLNTITEDLVLSERGPNGSSIVWTSSNPTVISPDGTVRRQSRNETVVLSCSVTYMNVTQTKTFPPLTVLKKDTTSNTGGSGGGGNVERIAFSNPEPAATPDILPENPLKDAIFSDLGDAVWAEEAINSLYEKGVVNGIDGKNFEPLKNIAREEFVKILILAFSVDNEYVDTTHFMDADKDAWYYKYIMTAKAAGISEGGPEGNFGVGQYITRQDLFVMAYRTAKLLGKSFADADESVLFSDDKMISDYARIPIYELKASGILEGGGENKVNPLNNATRAEACVIINRLLKEQM